MVQVGIPLGSLNQFGNLEELAEIKMKLSAHRLINVVIHNVVYSAYLRLSIVINFTHDLKL